MWTFPSVDPPTCALYGVATASAVLFSPEYCWTALWIAVLLQPGSVNAAPPAKAAASACDLQMTLVHVPVRDVDDESRDEDERSRAQRR